MTDLQIELKILELITRYPSCTPFLIKQEFNTRYHKKVLKILEQLKTDNKLHVGSDFFIKPGPSK